MASNFENLFGVDPNFMANLDNELEHDENAQLAANGKNAGNYDYNSKSGHPNYTIGYGYDLHTHTGSQIVQDFTAAGIGSVVNGTYSLLVDGVDCGSFIAAYNMSTASKATLDEYLSGKGPGQNGKPLNISGSTALTLLKNTIQEKEMELSATITKTINENSLTGTYLADNVALATGQTTLNEMLLSEYFNSGEIVTNQVQSIAGDDLDGFIANTLFDNATNGSKSLFDSGIENRRIYDFAIPLQLKTTPADGQSGDNTMYSALDFGANLTAAAYTFSGLESQAQSIQHVIASYPGATSTSDPTSALSNFYTNTLLSSETSLQSVNLYGVTEKDTWASIAAKYSMDARALQALNGSYLSSSGTIVQLSSTPDVDPNFGPGAVIHTSSDTVKGFPAINAIRGLDQQHTMLYNLDTGRTYVINTDLTNGQYLGGWLYVINGSGASVFLSPASEISSATVDPYGNLDINNIPINASLLYDVQPGDATSLSGLADQLNLDPSILSLINPDLDSDNLSSGTYVQTYGQGTTLPDFGTTFGELDLTGPNSLIDLTTNTAYAVGSAPGSGNAGTLYVSENGQLLTTYSSSYGFGGAFALAYTEGSNVYVQGGPDPSAYPPAPYVLELSSDTGGWTAFLGDDANVLGGSYTLSAGSPVPDGISLNDGATVNVDTNVTSATTFDFASAGTKLVVADTYTFGSSASEGYTGPLLEQFSAGDAIDLSGLPYVKGSMSWTYTADTGLLQISNGTQSATLFFGAGNTIVDDPFHLNTDGAGGTVLTNDAPLCFLRGTRILTPAGEVPVEDLRIGDLVFTLSCGAQSIRWIGIGKQIVPVGRRSPATPVIVRRDAIAPGVPKRDLYVTKGHALYIQGSLIPAEFLVNHRSIVWDDNAREVEYYHIELHSHEVLLAEGAPAESYRDEGNRWMFGNANPDWDKPGVAPHAPILTGGAKLDSIWVRLLARSGERLMLPTIMDPDLHLLVDGVRVDGVQEAGNVFVFPLPAGLQSVVIASRAAAQDELGRCRDPRRLGVAICRIELCCGGAGRLTLDAAMLTGPGFHGFEPEEECTWTNGHALLPPYLCADLEPQALHVHVRHVTHYAAPEKQGRLAA